MTTIDAAPEQIEAAGKAAWKAFAAIPDDSDLSAPQMWSLMGVAALAAATPLFEAQVRERVAAEIIDVRRSSGEVKGSAGSPQRVQVDRVLHDAAVRVISREHAEDTYPATWLEGVLSAGA